MTMNTDILRGLLSQPKQTDAKYLYDAAGSELFEQITKQPEYYPTRTEIDILFENAQTIAELAGSDAALIEYGSGASVKSRILLDVMHPKTYVPIDICGAQLQEAVASIDVDYPRVKVHPVGVDYTKPFSLPDCVEGRKIGFFPGSTIGNFHPSDAAMFLLSARTTLGYGAGFILGVDRVKDPAVLRAAYNDAKGVTAQFNKNLLNRLNREMGADFRLDHFAHTATWNNKHQRMEMHLISLDKQTVVVDGIPIQFDQGETIWTESSYKYNEVSIEMMLGWSGWKIKAQFTDPEDKFWVLYLEP